jgi:DNA mismatch repair protein MutH
MQYDPKSQSDILRYSAKLINKSLANVADIPAEVLNKKNKGQLGLLVEKYFFGLEVNNRPEPDFFEAGLELKVTGLIPKKDEQLRAKERLSLTHINFHEIVNESFETSSLVKKCSKILILCYLYEASKNEVDRVFTHHQFIYSLLEQDLQVLKSDWETIKQKVIDGKAHELSEGDTYFLKASRKGQGGPGEKLVSQPFSEKSAKKRGFSLPYNYLTQQIYGAPRNEGSIDAETLIDLEKSTHQLLSNFIGGNTYDLATQFQVNTKAKSFRFNLLTRMLSGGQSSVRELRKSDIQIKTVVLNKKGSPREHMSFSAFNYGDVEQQDWEDSDFFHAIEQKFLLVVFQQHPDGTETLKKVVYWNMPYEDRRVAQEVWEETKHRIVNENFIFPASSESEISHVRPHARRRSDTVSYKGHDLRKLSFWLNKSYIKKVVEGLN